MKNNMIKNKGVTLVEVTVVLAIAGVIVAFALPRYQLAVEKGKAEDGVNILNAIYGSQKRFELYNGAFATDINDLDLTIPASEYFQTPALVGGGSPVLANIQRDGNIYTLAINEDGELTCQGANCTKMGFTVGDIN